MELSIVFYFSQIDFLILIFFQVVLILILFLYYLYFYLIILRCIHIFYPICRNILIILSSSKSDFVNISEKISLLFINSYFFVFKLILCSFNKIFSIISFCIHHFFHKKDKYHNLLSIFIYLIRFNNHLLNNL